MSSRTGGFFMAIILLSAFYFNLNAQGKDKHPDTIAGASLKTGGIVVSKSGLILRLQSSSKAAKIIHMPQGAIVRIHEKNGPVETLHGITTNWYRVSYSNKEGWAFGGFIKELKYDLLDAYKTGDVELFLYRNGEFEMQVNMCNGLAFVYGNYKMDKNIIKCRVREIKGSGFMGDDITEFGFNIVNDKTIEYQGKPVGCGPVNGNRLDKFSH